QSEPPGRPGRGPRPARPHDRLQAARQETPAPAVDGTGAGEEHRGDERPRVALVQQQEDVGAQALLRVGGTAAEIQQGIAVAGTKRDTEWHGLASEVSRLVLHRSPWTKPPSLTSPTADAYTVAPAGSYLAAFLAVAALLGYPAPTPAAPPADK